MALAPRKQPRQDRARATVDAILQATTYILTHAGWDALTTKSIADRAGVNIASLYQYFPNKTAIVAELRRRHVEALQGCAVQDPPPKTLRAALARAVDTLIKQRLTNPELHRVFADELPRSSGVPVVERPSTWDSAMLPDVPDLEMAGFVARAAILAAIDQAAREHPGWLARREFRDELVLLLERYLIRPR